MPEGSQIGTYRVLRKIGEGGMGSVWMAEHSMLGRRAAIKVLHPEFSHRPEFVTRFFNEARAATSIEDPGIVQVFDFGTHTDGSAYIVMELLDGEPLDKRIRQHGSLGVNDALRIMRQVASTLGAAHARGIVHRDIKPENIFLIKDAEVLGGERAKVLDFGIAKLVHDQGGVKTKTSAVMGTPTYMSPEQCRGAGHVDQRSDVYALGCVLFRLICGRPPFDAEGSGELIAMHLREAPPMPSSLRPGIPREVDALVMCCLAKDPAYRYPSGYDLARAIGALIGSSPQVPPPPASYAPAAPLPTTLAAATGAMTTREKKPRTRMLVAGGIGVAAAGVVIAIVTTTSSAEQPATAPATPSPAPAPPPPAPAPPPAAATVAPTPPPPPNTDREVATQTKTILAAFATWARGHANEPCPGAAELGIAIEDPWHHAYRITCTDQPGDQIAGVISSGPDGVAGTADDIASWQLGRDVTEVVHGPRWTVAVKPHTKPTTTKPTTKPADTHHHIELDENGLPISR